MLRIKSTAIVSVVALAIIALLIACSNDNDDSPGSPTPPPAATSGTGSQPPPTATLPPPGPPADEPTGPGPRSGAPCPVEREVCDFAERIFAIVDAGDIDGLVALAEPVEATCPSAGLGGPSPSLCQGAAVGEVRRGYWDIQAGEGLVVPEADWRRTLQRWVSGIEAATGNDAYGPGGLRIGAISCAREPAQPPGVCGPDNIRIHMTFINAPDTDPAMGTGLPGKRVSFSFSTHRDRAGALKIEGFGTIVPPNTVLLAFRTDAVDSNGRPVLLQFYPWTP